MKTLRTLCVLMILSGVIFFGLKIDAKDIDIPFLNSLKKVVSDSDTDSAANSKKEPEGKRKTAGCHPLQSNGRTPAL